MAAVPLPPKPPAGSGFNATPYAADTPDVADIRRDFLRWAELTHKADKTADETTEQQNLTENLARHGLLANDKILNAVLEGTAYDPKKVRDQLLGQVDPNQNDVGSILSGALNTNSNTKRSVDINSNTVTKTNRTTTQYVDLPTADEFLDNFDNAFMMHVNGLVQSGALRPEVADFAFQNKSMFFGDYLREQVGRLLKGDPLFRVTGTNADEKLIGTRRGDFTRDQSQQTGTQQTNTSQSTSSSSVPSETPAGKAIDSAQNANESETLNSNRTEDNTTDTQEAIVQRNKLGVVANLAPLDFLKDGATAQRLNFLYAGHKGDQQRQVRTAAGQDFSGAARRI